MSWCSSDDCIRILGRERTNTRTNGLYPKRVTKYAKATGKYKPRVADVYELLADVYKPRVELYATATNQRIGQNRLNAAIRLHSYFDQLSKVIR